MKCELHWEGGDTIDDVIGDMAAIAANTKLELVYYSIVFVSGGK